MSIFAPLKHFNRTVWLIIIATFFIKFTFIMAWPFLAILLYEKFGLSALEAGQLLAAAVSAGVIFGFYVGNLSDRFGRRKIILVGIAFSSISGFMLGFANDLWVVGGSILLSSLSRAMIEDPSKALMTDMLPDRDAKDMSLHMRYFILNIGAAFGPLLGVYLALDGDQRAFHYVGATYLAYFFFAAFIFYKDQPAKKTQMAQDSSFSAMILTLRKDYAFLIFVLSTFLIYLAFAQIDMAMLQYLRLEDIKDYAQLYALSIFVNGTTIVVFQFPLLKLLKDYRTHHKVTIGLVLFLIAFLIWAYPMIDIYYSILLGMFVLSVGEAILFPTFGILVDKMAPEHLKGSYFGAASFAGFGWAIAPMVGGFLLDFYGGVILWLSMFAFCFIALLLFWYANQFSPTKNNNPSNVEI